MQQTSVTSAFHKAWQAVNKLFMVEVLKYIVHISAHILQFRLSETAQILKCQRPWVRVSVDSQICTACFIFIF